MSTLNLNFNTQEGKWLIKSEIVFNSLLIKYPRLIRKFIKSIYPLYKIYDSFFEIVNNYVDLKEDNKSSYCGLIVRTGLDDYAILFLEGTTIHEEAMLKEINDYINDVGDYIPKEVNISKFEVSEKEFTKAIKKL